MYNVLSDCRGFYEGDIIDTIWSNRNIDSTFDNFVSKILTANKKHFNKVTFDKNKYDEAIEIINNSDDITVLFDVDVDGVTSGAIITRYLRDKKNIIPIINRGKKHGLDKMDLDSITNTLIVVDSLDATINNYKYLHDKGVKIIVLDHHNIDENVPYDDYVTLISSERSQSKALSGAGVVLKFVFYMAKKLKDLQIVEDLFDLAACGIIADVMDMTDLENRYIVCKGLNNLKNPALKQIIGSWDFNSKAISYSVSPLINACMRINKNELALKLFISDDIKEIKQIIKDMKACREFQNEEVDRIIPSVEEQFDKQCNEEVLYAMIDSYYGIAGLIGNKLLEKYKKPMLILKERKNKYTGSMRSIGFENFNKMCNDTGLAECHGHNSASGFECLKDDFNTFIDEIRLETDLTPRVEITDDIDAYIEYTDITTKLINLTKNFDLVTGKNFKPISYKVSIDVTEDMIKYWSDGKHTVINVTESLIFIIWNFNEVDNILGYTDFYISLESGFVGRKFYLKGIVSDFERTGA